MILGPQHYSLVGAQGVALTVYKLRRIGINATEVCEGLPFDLLAFADNRVIRIQAKATQAVKAGHLTFMTAKGRYAKATKHSIDLTSYTAREVDLIALAALPFDRVIFKPVTEVGQSVRLPAIQFQTEDVELTSFNHAIRSVFGRECACLLTSKESLTVMPRTPSEDGSMTVH